MSVPLVHLDHLAEIVGGYPHRPKGRERGAPTHRLVRISAIDERASTIDPEACIPFLPGSSLGDAVLRPGDVVLATRGERRGAGVVLNANGQSLVASEQVVVLRPRPEVDSRYLAWALNSPSGQRQLGALSRGSNIPFVATADLAEIRIPVPPLETQRRLVRLVDLVQREHDLCERLAELRLELAHALVAHASHPKEAR